MSEEQIRIEIAKFCGWKRETRSMYGGERNVKGWGFNTHLGRGDKDRLFYSSTISFPDYCNDLNAIHQVENKLSDELYRKFVTILRADYWERTKGATSDGCISATAMERAEAIVQAIKK